MGIPDRSLLDLIEKLRSWISWGTSDLASLPREFEMSDNHRNMCYDCELSFTDTLLGYDCRSCGRMLCANCVQGYGSMDVMSGDGKSRVVDIRDCQFCSEISTRTEGPRKYSDKIYPADSPRQSPEPPSLCCSGERLDGYSLHDVNRCNSTSLTGYPAPVSVCCSPSRSDEEEAEDSARTFFSPSSEYCNDTSDIDSSSISARQEFYCFKSVGSSPSDSPSRIHITSKRVGHYVQKEQGETLRYQNDGPFDQVSMAVLRRPERGIEDPENSDDCTDDYSIFRDQCETMQKPLDFEKNGLLWFPPPPEDEDDEAESNFFAYDDDDDEIGDTGVVFSSSSSLASSFPAKEKHNEGQKEPLKAVVQGHFRALVSQLLQGEGITLDKETGMDDWLDIVTTIAWQAANFVRPDTSRGGSMDPGDYVKVKCIASGSPRESTIVRGVVCTKNIKHKRMTSQYKNPRLLLLGGALEYQRVPTQLSSFDTLLQQEIDHLKMIVSRIEAHRPNVLLVEKSVSSYAQEYLLEKEISLVLNVKRPLLECIARCTGALITPSIDNISKARVGQCELFRLERVSEELEKANQFNKRPSKTLMFFEGCPRRLGCTVLLKGSCREELKKIKHVVQYAVFAAYHLSLETSFLADEGASLPKLRMTPSIAMPERAADNAIQLVPKAVSSIHQKEIHDDQDINEISCSLDIGAQELSSEHLNPYCGSFPSCRPGYVSFDACNDNLASNMLLEDIKDTPEFSTEIRSHTKQELLETTGQEEGKSRKVYELKGPERVDENDASSEYYSATDGHQSILVSFSSRCVVNGTVCERSRLLRIKFYGSFDKPLGRYLRDDLFNQASNCPSCKEPVEAHVLCYTHQQGNLTINVRRLPSMKLPGERDGRIWMWHRCLKCAQIGGVPPATRRVVMSDAAWGLSFGKFLELSFSNHATANRVASCGHSLQKDCLRYYGFGNMVAFFRYSPIDILSVHLPPSVLDFNGFVQQDWIRKEAEELLSKTEAVYTELSAVLDSFEQKSRSLGHGKPDGGDLHDQIMELQDLLIKESSDYKGLLHPSHEETSPLDQRSVDILELNRLRRSLVIGSHVWDRRLYSLDSLLKTNEFTSKVTLDATSPIELKAPRSQDISLNCGHEENESESSKLQVFPKNTTQSKQKDDPNFSPSEPIVPEDSIPASCQHYKQEDLRLDGEIPGVTTPLDCAPLPASNLSDKIDSAWTGTDQFQLESQFLNTLKTDGRQVGSVRHASQTDNPSFRRLVSPARVYSFDSALRLQERIMKGLPPSSLHLSAVRSFHASGEYRSMVRDPVSYVHRTYSKISPKEAQKFNLLVNSTPSFISTMSLMPAGARLLLPHTGQSNLVIAVYDNEPTSIISYALSSKEYEEWIADRPNMHERSCMIDVNGVSSAAPTFSAWPSFGSLDLDHVNYGGYGSEDASSTISALFTEPKNSHLKISFEDESSNAAGKVKFSVTCYFAKQFDALRKECCPNEVDFMRSLSRCERWSAQGGKSNVYFAKSLDERLIIKQVQKTELESFEEFAPEYFKYLTDSLNTGSPTCLAKVLGIYQVTVKHLKGGREIKMDLMVMENLFFKRSISRVYDLKGSARSRYNADTTGRNNVLLDMNLLETLRTKPIFLGRKAKRSLERAVWNDTSFLASVDVMDYSLLVGVDDERKELVIGIIDFMRQYTWDKHLETWVKESGILGGPRNASPTIISPKQYKRRFRKAMTTYFLTVPDQWSS